MSFSSNKLIVQSDNVISLGDPAVPLGDTGFKNTETDAFINDATSVEIIEWLDKGLNTRVTGFTPAVDMPYVSASNGVYTVTVSTTIGDSLIIGNEYEIQIKAIDAGGNTKVFYLQVFAERGG